MNQNNLLTAKCLTYSGTLPLIASAVGLMLHIHGVDFVFIAIAYSAVILSFLCGIHWAVYIFFADRCSFNLFIISNIVALCAWSSLLLQHNIAALVLQLLCFVVLFIVDGHLFKKSILPAWFYRLRRNATAMVVLSLLILSFFA